MAIIVNMKFRIEIDSLGKIKVPTEKYWGASTERSNKYFDIGDFLVRPIVIKSIAMIKKAAAIVNAKNGDLEKKTSKIIILFSVHWSSFFKLLLVCNLRYENSDRIYVSTHVSYFYNVNYTVI